MLASSSPPENHIQWRKFHFGTEIHIFGYKRIPLAAKLAEPNWLSQSSFCHWLLLNLVSSIWAQVYCQNSLNIFSFLQAKFKMWKWTLLFRFVPFMIISNISFTFRAWFKANSESNKMDYFRINPEKIKLVAFLKDRIGDYENRVKSKLGSLYSVFTPFFSISNNIC